MSLVLWMGQAGDTVPTIAGDDMAKDLVTNYKGQILAAQNLPALPAAVQEISRLMEDPNTSTEQLTKVIVKDQALAAKVLKMVNSPIYGFPGRISSVQHAIVLLGMNVIRGLIISTAVFDAMNKGMLGLWEHSLGCSLASSEIARITGQNSPEEFAVMGLLHDVGKMAFSLQLPTAKADMDKLVAQQDIYFREAEKQVLGFGHERVNSWLCEHWNLPLFLREGIVYHHDPLAAQFHPEASSVVHLADFMVRLFQCGSGGDNNVPALDPGALRLLGIKHKLMEKILDVLVDKFSDSSVFNFA